MQSWLVHHRDPARPELAASGGRGARGVERVRYLDLLRPLATGCVVYSHWILIGLTYYRGRFSDLNVLDHIEWGRWVTWAFSVMPAFFLVGGYANACPWTAHHARGERWNWWIQRRACGCGGRRRCTWG